MHISRRRFLAGAAIGAAAATSRMSLARGIRIEGSTPTELRLLGTAPARGVTPYVQALPGLAGFYRRIREVGATAELTWLGPAATPGETAVLLAGFEPSGASHDGQTVTIFGRTEPTSIQVFAVDRRALTGARPVTLRISELSDEGSGVELARTRVWVHP